MGKIRYFPRQDLNEASLIKVGEASIRELRARIIGVAFRVRGADVKVSYHSSINVNLIVDEQLISWAKDTKIVGICLYNPHRRHIAIGLEDHGQEDKKRKKHKRDH